MRAVYRTLVVALTAFGLSGCATDSAKKEAAGPTLPPAMPPTASVAAQVRAYMDSAEKLYRRGFYDAALGELAKALPLEPRNERLHALFYEIQANQLAQRAKQVEQEQKLSVQKATIEVESNKLIPLSYSQRRPISAEPDDTKTPLTALEQALGKKVSLHFENSDLGAVLLKLGEEFKIPIIGDPAALQGKSITIHVDNVPLREVFDFLTRNQQVAFYVGENVVWMTQPAAPESPVPFETRIYHLRQGVNYLLDEEGASGSNPTQAFQTLGGGGQLGGLLGQLGGLQGGGALGGYLSQVQGQGGGAGQRQRGGGAQRQAAGGAQQPGGANAAGAGPDLTTLEQAIRIFVAQPQGSQLLFDRPSHVLISKNTRENNMLIEKLIQTLDIGSKQLLIEARFVQIDADDLAELGIDFTLNSPYAVTKNDSGQPKTQFDTGDIINYGAFPNATEGLNFTYRGVLTDPMFKAVLHALETSKKAHTISTPRITTVNNRRAHIRVGEDFLYYFTYTAQSVLTSTSPTGVPIYTTQVLPSGSPALRQTGIALDVTPSVGANSDNIVMVLEPSITAFVRYETFQTLGTTTQPSQQTTTPPAEIRLPIFSTSEVTSKAVVRSGETVVLGGLIKAADSKERKEPPILGKIPIIGRLFRHNTDTATRSNLLIFVTATLISPEGQSQIPTTPVGQ